ncbi:MAG: thiamine-phosphate kinase [Flavobacteriales bacterium]
MLEDKNANRTPLNKLGEFGLIKHLTQHIKTKNLSTIKGIGDDAAVLEFKEEKTVVSTDFLIEGIHFNMAYTPLKHLGYKAVIVNLSDICAMNATPTQITVSIAVSNRFPIEALEELYDGIITACNIYNVDFVGGDTTSSHTGLILSITAIGKAKEESIVYRNGAKENDLIVVTGDLGAAFLGLKILERENEVFKANPDFQPDLEQYTYLIQRQLRPEARADVKTILKKLDIKPTSMIDLSDGLSSDLLHICDQSQVGCSIYEEKIPLDPAVMTTCEEFKINTTTIALNGGEDYELLFTISLEDHQKIKNNPHFTVIGHITDQASGKNMMGVGNQTQFPLTAQGWDALSKK